MRSGEESHTGLKHFVGVVENRKDPLSLGRYIRQTKLLFQQPTYLLLK